jgi:hypothetical protein
MATEPGPAIGPPAGRGGWDNTQAHTELELESFLNLSGAWLGWSKGQPACWSAKPPAWCRTVEYYSCFNSFNGFCPFHLFGIFEHTNWHNITDAFPCPGDEPVCQYRQPRSMWQYDVTAGERFPTPAICSQTPQVSTPSCGGAQPKTSRRFTSTRSSSQGVTQPRIQRPPRGGSA